MKLLLSGFPLQFSQCPKTRASVWKGYIFPTPESIKK